MSKSCHYGRRRPARSRVILAACLWLLPTASAKADPWADAIVGYEPGVGADFGYTDPAVALGSPERFTGEADFGGAFQSAVTPFNPAFGTDELVSIGLGGRLTVRFDQPITDDPDHLYGVDLIIFGNGSFIDGDYPNGEVAGLFAEGLFAVSVSDDGASYVALPGAYNDAFLPALGYRDQAGPYDTTPGAMATDFTRPVDPSLTLSDFAGNYFSEVVAMYDGSGGGIPIDIGPSGLNAIHYVRIDVLGGPGSPDIDAFAAVPEPGVGTLLLCGPILLVLCRRRSHS